MNSEQSSPTPEEEFRRLRKVFEMSPDALSAAQHQRLFELIRELGNTKTGKIISEVLIEVDQEEIKRRS